MFIICTSVQHYAYILYQEVWFISIINLAYHLCSQCIFVVPHIIVVFFPTVSFWMPPTAKTIKKVRNTRHLFRCQQYVLIRFLWKVLCKLPKNYNIYKCSSTGNLSTSLPTNLKSARSLILDIELARGKRTLARSTHGQDVSVDMWWQKLKKWKKPKVISLLRLLLCESRKL